MTVAFFACNEPSSNEYVILVTDENPFYRARQLC